MRTVIFAYYLNNEWNREALRKDKEQSLNFMCSYKVREKRITVCDIEECQV